MDAIELTEKIKPHAVQIARQSNGGSKKAKAVIDLHRMVCARPEAGAVGLCKAAFEDWLKEQ